MLNQDNPPRYFTYLLRCWEERGDDPLGDGSWRFSLEAPHTGRSHGFVDLDALVAFLRIQEAASHPAADAHARHPDRSSD